MESTRCDKWLQGRSKRWSGAGLSAANFIATNGTRASVNQLLHSALTIRKHGASDGPKEGTQKFPQDCALPPEQAGNQFIWDFIFHHQSCFHMAGFLNNMSHHFGDTTCQDAFIVRLQQSAQFTPEVKADRQTDEDDLSCSAANFIATITNLHATDVRQSHLRNMKNSNASTAATASSRGTSRKSASSGSNEINGLQQPHRITPVSVATVESLACERN